MTLQQKNHMLELVIYASPVVLTLQCNQDERRPTTKFESVARSAQPTTRGLEQSVASQMGMPKP